MRSAEIKAIAKSALKGNWFVAIISSFVASFFGASTMNTFSFSIDLSTLDTNTPEDGGEVVATAFKTMTEDVLPSNAWEGLLALLLAFGIGAIIYSLIIFIIGSAVSVGYSQFNLDIIDGADARVGTLFDRFSQIGTVIGAKILGFVYTLIGFIFFIIPGIRLAFAYSMVHFVLADNPDMKAGEALHESRRIMKGHKWKFFCLECSFIIPAILCIFTLGIGFIWLVPYMNAAYAAFYRNAKNEADFG